MLYITVASFIMALFIATVYYLLVLFQFPSVPLSSGYWLGLFVLIFGMIKYLFSKTNGQKLDSTVLVIAGILLLITTYIVILLDIQI